MSNNNIINNSFDFSDLLITNIDNDLTFNQLLLNSADINIQNASGWCVLFEAVTSNLNEKIEEFIKRGANIDIETIKAEMHFFGLFILIIHKQLKYYCL